LGRAGWNVDEVRGGLSTIEPIRLGVRTDLDTTRNRRWAGVRWRSATARQ
jgi:hypothetical protein